MFISNSGKRKVDSNLTYDWDRPLFFKTWIFVAKDDVFQVLVKIWFSFLETKKFNLSMF